ncbi:hypothetical protein L964_599 [Leuconostoc pseudomesenteroides 1159]|nr:hypothetical protein L964_599 [Leuconostoc pseudomesenteroides 1159]
MLKLLPEKGNLKFLYLGTPDNGRPQFLIEGSDADALTVTPVGKLVARGIEAKRCCEV